MRLEDAQNKHEHFTADLRRCKTGLNYPLAVAEDQDFAASVLNSAVSRLAMSDTLVATLPPQTLTLRGYFPGLVYLSELIVFSIWDKWPMHYSKPIWLRRQDNF